MWHKAALEAGPDHVPAHLSYGKWLAKNVSYEPYPSPPLSLLHLSFFFRREDFAPGFKRHVYIFIYDR